jgi:hypothetical protein
MPTEAQIAANRANSGLSTGPRTPEGKSRSAENNLRHGLASGRLTLPGESTADFDLLEADLLKHHRPANVTETLLVQKMAQHYWLTQRAILQQTNAIAESCGEVPKSLAIFIRYETTHERAYYKALAVLTSLQKERRKEEIGFVPQKAKLKVEPSTNKPSQTAGAAANPLPDPAILPAPPVSVTPTESVPPLLRPAA